jgi:predicted nucleotidyltransferase/DNA-binding HxlR family transcriptional regulator
MPTLESILGDRLNITLLRWLSNVRRPMSGNAIARQLGIPQTSARQALERLVATGVVTRTDIGRAAAYALNEDLSVVRRVVVPLFRREEDLRASLLGELVDSIQDLTRAASSTSSGPARFVALYGSLARGERDYRDIDLLVVSASRDLHSFLRDYLTDVGERIERRYGVPLRPIIVAEAEVTTARVRALVAEVRAHGLGLGGEPPKALVGVRMYEAIPKGGAA